MSEEPTGKQRRKRGRIENLKPWPKGVSGNPKGRPKGPSLVEALRKVLVDMGEDETLKKLARAWVAHSAKGNAVFFKEMIERLDGKVPQKTELTGAEGGPIEVKKWSTEEAWQRYREVLCDSGRDGAN